MPAERRAVPYALTRVSVAVSAVVAFGAVMVSPAAAATVPQAATSCHGTLSKAASAEEPNNLQYSFSCSNPISAYTLLANRTLSDFTVVDDFSTTADVLDATGAIVPGEAFGCEGAIPGSGVNCNAGATSAGAPQFMSAGHSTRGTFDLSDPYCPSIPAGSRPGTNPLPKAMVQLVVTDSTGAQGGPFRINLNATCPVVKPVPKLKVKAKPNHKHRSTGRKKGHK